MDWFGMKFDDEGKHHAPKCYGPKKTLSFSGLEMFRHDIAGRNVFAFSSCEEVTWISLSPPGDGPGDVWRWSHAPSVATDPTDQLHSGLHLATNGRASMDPPCSSGCSSTGLRSTAMT